MLLRDAIHIPTEVHQGDLVFRLADAVADATATLDHYVVTTQLLESFQEAVGVVRSAVDEGVSKATYLSGSFGAGKSNFMGVLQLLLDGHPGALAHPKLAPAVAQLRDWQGERRFLTVPFHLIGARDLESAILGGYVEHVRRNYPKAPLPDVFASEALLENADSMRTLLGDEAFFNALGSGDDAGWGRLAGWTADRYDAARRAPVGADERGLLVGALVAGLFSGFADMARAESSGYVDLDQGLAAISRHAKALGYAGVILFLDELILWLLSKMAAVEFVTSEASKLSKLVETARADRPVPIISVIARQRDLRELVGHEVLGVEKMSFVAQLDYQQGRFGNIVLDDSNLPEVANRRLLQPVDTHGAAALEAAFAGLHLSDATRDVLSGEFGGVDAFRLTYPFSPALLKIVVDVASALQRTRTGLRVLLQLLVEQRDELTVGGLIPVGDLYDVLASSEEPLSEEMKAAFLRAKRIYADRFRPLLLTSHGLSPGSDPTPAFRTDDRLVKTLLLSALVPNCPAFRNLTVSRLIALNHGLITSPVPGQEISVVTNKLRSWAPLISELQLGADANDPTVAIVLSDIDTRIILDSVAAYDNVGARRQLIRSIVLGDLGLPLDQLLPVHKVRWKGVVREVDLRFGNVRDTGDLADSDFASAGEKWRVIIDFPFDDDGRSIMEDLQRIDRLRSSLGSARTLVWLPSFFTPQIREQLGNLVRLNQLLTGPDQFNDATKNLSPTQRAAARPLLEAQQSSTRRQLNEAILQAYGVRTADPAVVDTTHGLGDHFPSLQIGFTVRPPVLQQPTLSGALDEVVGQALNHSYPAAPSITRDVRTPDLRKVLEICDQALEHADGRLALVPSTDRPLMTALANPLKLGVQSEQAFVIERMSGHWDAHFTRRLGERSQRGDAGDATVADLRVWIDQPAPMGLTREIQDLVLIVWARATNRTFRDHGGPAQIDIGRLGDGLTVVAQPLPGPAEWDRARERAERIFGTPGLPELASAQGLAKLSQALISAVSSLRAGAHDLETELAELIALAGDGGEPARLRTARSARALTDALAAATDDLGRVDALAAAEVEPSPEAVGKSLSSAAAVVAAVRALDHAVLGAAFARPEGAALGTELAALLNVDELGAPLVAPLQRLYGQARDIVLPPHPLVERQVETAPPRKHNARMRQVESRDVPEALQQLETLRARLAAHEVSDVVVSITYFEPDDRTGA
jgi:hypothetical protein